MNPIPPAQTELFVPPVHPKCRVFNLDKIAKRAAILCLTGQTDQARQLVNAIAKVIVPFSRK